MITFKFVIMGMLAWCLLGMLTILLVWRRVVTRWDEHYPTPPQGTPVNLSDT
jgi:hypothetical protein